MVNIHLQAKQLEDLDKSSEYSEYFDKDMRGGCDGQEFTYSAFIDAIFENVDLYEKEVVDFLKEGSYEIAYGE